MTRNVLKIIAIPFAICISALPFFCRADVISASASSSGSTSTATWPNLAVDGDFSYDGNQTHTLAGNGIDDVVTWTFDFTTDPNYLTFSGTIISAQLSLTFTPKNRFFLSDQVGVKGLIETASPIDSSTAVNVMSTVNLELLNIYTSEEIISVLSSEIEGQLPMQYADDARLTHAELVLTAAVLLADVDHDGDIDDTDLATMFINYTGPVGPEGNKTFAQGDTDGDGDVDDSDLGTAFAGYTGPLGPAAVPEPASAAILLISSALLLRRRQA